MKSTPIAVAARLGVSAALAVSGIIHAYLYVESYRHIPTVGVGFLWQASAFCALAVLIVLGGPRWLVWAGGLFSAGALIAFAASRTVGLFGFTERGLQPSPQALISIVVELVAVALAGALLVADVKGR